MKYQDLFELRRNPEQNPKIAGKQQVIDILKNMKHTERGQYGISMTELPKLGINPQSQYHTPLGIYFYPADYFYTIVSSGRELPFQDNAPYIQLFKFDTSKTLFLDEVTKREFNQVVDRMYFYGDQLGKLSKKFNAELEDVLTDIDYAAAVQSPAGKLWYMTYRMSSVKPQSSSVFWNKMMRDLGYSSAIDPGKGIIHVNEPTSGVIFDPRIIQSVKTFNNTTPVSSDVSTDMFRLFDLAVKTGKRNKKLEGMILNSGDPEFVVKYAKDVLKGQWPEGEEMILKSGDPRSMYLYAGVVRKWAWPAAEPTLAKSDNWGFAYASNVLHDAQPHMWAERYIETHTK